MCNTLCIYYVIRQASFQQLFIWHLCCIVGGVGVRKGPLPATSGLRDQCLGGDRLGGIIQSTLQLQGGLISHKKPFSFWTSHFMFWRRQLCKCSARHQSSHTRIVSPAGDRLILKRWWLTCAHVSGCTALWCRQSEGDGGWVRWRRGRWWEEEEGKDREK